MDVDHLLAPDATTVSRTVVGNPDVYQAEVDRIFGRCWLFVGHESQIPEPGDFVTTTMGPQPVIVTRDRNRRIQVLLNTCRHRGSVLCRADRGSAMTFACPNHGWTYGIDGRLLGVPRQMEGFAAMDKGQFGLAAAAQVATYHRLIFATLDPDAEPLESYLGDSRFYLDVVFDPTGVGTELLDGIHRWPVQCDWKLPAENQSPDLYHFESAHAAVAEANDDDAPAYLGPMLQVVTDAGHTLAIRPRLQDGLATDDLLVASADSAEAGTEIAAYLAEVRARTEEHLGHDRARFETIAGTIFPNLSFISNMFNLRMSQPRGPGQIEMQSWCFVPADAPPSVRSVIRRVYQLSFGPAGLVEAEDCENWTSMTSACTAPLARDVPLYIGMGAGREFRDPELPGVLNDVWSEHAMRGFWQHWRRRMMVPS